MNSESGVLETAVVVPLTGQPTPADLEKMRRDDVRAEYAAVVGYHTALVIARFTIAGLLTGSSAFLAVAATAAERPPIVKVLCGGFAVWITLCTWLLELRTRTLYRSLSSRGIEIEREEWGLHDARWNKGFFSRQYKMDPANKTPDVAEKPEYDPVKVFGIEFPTWVGRRVLHSNAFDLLYGGAGLLWLLFAIHYGSKVDWVRAARSFFG
jgi:hypothetical protein